MVEILFSWENGPKMCLKINVVLVEELLAFGYGPLAKPKSIVATNF